MSSTYNGNPASGAWTPALSITEPADADTLNAASVNTALSKLADYIAFLQANAGQKGGSNTWTAAQTIQAIVSLTNNLAFSAAVAQTLLKTAAGGLTVGTAAGGGDLTLSANGVAMLKLLASGSMDGQGKTLANIGAPAAATDAMRYGDSFAKPAWQSPLSLGTSWSSSLTTGYIKDRLGFVHLEGSALASAGVTATLLTLNGAGLKPGNTRYFPVVYLTGGTTPTVRVVQISSGGVYTLQGAAPAATDIVVFDGINFLGEI